MNDPVDPVTIDSAGPFSAVIWALASLVVPEAMAALLIVEGCQSKPAMCSDQTASFRNRCSLREVLTPYRDKLSQVFVGTISPSWSGIDPVLWSEALISMAEGQMLVLVTGVVALSIWTVP